MRRFQRNHFNCCFAQNKGKLAAFETAATLSHCVVQVDLTKAVGAVKNQSLEIVHTIRIHKLGQEERFIVRNIVSNQAQSVRPCDAIMQIIMHDQEARTREYALGH